MRKPLLALTVPALAVLAAGCGSSHTTKHVRRPASKRAVSAKTKAVVKPTANAKTSKAAVKKTKTTRMVAVEVSSRTLPHLGTVLVDSAGRTLYVFAPDKAARVTCNSSCQAIWPPLKLAADARPVAVGPVKASLLGSDPNPVGGRVVTYDGWPLYTFTGDSAAGVATGEGLDLNGGRWYVISPSGRLIRSATRTTATSTHKTKSKAKSTSGGAGY
jgi:predicted lipoprotein with Yx(FWY)xxD motif